MASCRPGQLAAGFHGGGFGTGNDFGRIDVYNTGSTACELAGPVTVTAVDRRGGKSSPMRATTPSVALTGRARDFETQVPVGEQIMQIIVGGALTARVRTCPTGERVIPWAWHGRVGSFSFLVRNYDARNTGQDGAVVSVSGCEGRFLGITVEPLS